jgi:hypothetical protein
MRIGKRDAAKEMFWRRTLARYVTSGLTIAEFCKKEGLERHTFYHWRETIPERDATREQAKSLPDGKTDDRCFVPVTIRSNSASADPIHRQVVAELIFSGGSVLVFDGIGADTLRTLVQSLAEGTQ